MADKKLSILQLDYLMKQQEEPAFMPKFGQIQRVVPDSLIEFSMVPNMDWKKHIDYETARLAN